MVWGAAAVLGVAVARGAGGLLEWTSRASHAPCRHSNLPEPCIQGVVDAVVGLLPPAAVGAGGWAASLVLVAVPVEVELCVVLVGACRVPN